MPSIPASGGRSVVRLPLLSAYPGPCVLKDSAHMLCSFLALLADWLFPFHTDSSSLHPPPVSSVWLVLMFLSPERQPLALLYLPSVVYAPRDFRGQISFWRCNWNRGSHSSNPGYWLYDLILVDFCSWRAGRLIFRNQDWQREDNNSLQSLTSPLWIVDKCFLCWQSTVECFTRKVAL